MSDLGANETTFYGDGFDLAAQVKALCSEVERLRDDWTAEESGRLEAEASAECYRQQANNADVEITRAQEAENAARSDAAQLRQALIPFAFIGRRSMEPLGLADEYDHARKLLGL
jgi:hypothetical protein